MKQIIPFEKDITFNTRLYEITSISLEQDLKLKEVNNIIGTFNISGKYKMNEISLNEEEFNNNLPFDITLGEKYDTDDIKIDIDDFNYEIINEEILRIHIDVLVDNLKIKQEPIENIIIPDKEQRIVNIEIPEEKEEIIVEEDQKQEKNILRDNLTKNIIEMEEKYVTYKVHIIRENDTIDSICTLYDIKKEEIQKYNNIDKIMIGSKIIVPLYNE